VSLLRFFRDHCVNLWHTPAHHAEMMLLAFKFGWGLWVLAPWWTSFTPTNSYKTLLFWPEWVWGLGVVSLGMVHFLALVLEQWKLRRIVLLVVAVFWVVIVWTIGYQNPGSTGVSTYGIIAGATCLRFLRARSA
jgi:hypothetical protein